MTFNDCVIDLTEQTVEILPLIHKKFSGFNKLESVLLFRILGLPTLDTVILTDFGKEIFEFLKRKYKGKTFIVRTDRKKETASLPRAGYKSSTEDLFLHVPKLMGNGRIVFLLETSLSRYDHIYSMNLLFEYDRLIIEIVGRGFDVSDLNRGDISPHEILEIPLNYFYNFGSWDIYDLAPLDIACFRKFLVQKEEYRKSIELRLSKIGRGLTEGGKNDKICFEESLVKARKYLMDQGKTLIFEDNSNYQPIPFNLLKKIVRLVYYLPMEIFQFKKPIEVFSVSCGVYCTGQIVFWDIVFPSIKFDLSKIKLNKA